MTNLNKHSKQKILPKTDNSLLCIFISILVDQELLQLNLLEKNKNEKSRTLLWFWLYQTEVRCNWETY